jgi:hypothetical protein
MSWNVAADADFLRDKAAVLCCMTEEMFCV